MEPHESLWMASFQSFGSQTCKKNWIYNIDNCITKWKMNPIYILVPDFPADGLTPKVLFNRIREIAILILVGNYYG